MTSAGSLAALLRQTHLDDHDAVLNEAQASLRKSKDDLNAQLVRVVALLKLDRYEDALRALEEGGEQLKERAKLETAYGLYKVGRWDEAQSLAKKVPTGRAFKHVEAQAAYRLEKFDRAAELYRNLVSQAAEVENEENDLQINTGAVDAQLQWSGKDDLVQKKKPARADLEAFETAYNAACGSIARKDFSQAEVLLNRSKNLCNAIEELSDEEKKAELIPILGQQIYTLLMLGKVEDAQEVSLQLAIEDIVDLSTRRVVQNNSLAASIPQTNPYLAHRHFHAHTASKVTDKPFGFQADILRRNSYVLDLLCQKHRGVASSVSTYLSQQPLPTTSAHINSVSVIGAAATAQQETGKAALKAVLPMCERRPTDVGLLLTAIQLYMSTNNSGAAGPLMQRFLSSLEESESADSQGVRYAPGLVALHVSILERQGRKAHAKKELEKAAAYWRRKSKPPLPLLRVAGAELTFSSKPEDQKTASEIFAELRERDPDDGIAIAGFIAANAASSPEKVASDMKKLTPINRLIIGIDAEALENSGIPQLPSASSDASRKRHAEDNSKPAKKRVRKSRLPKNYDPSKPPDPERWLPLRERSTYKPKGRKGKAKAATLTQGGVSKAGVENSLGRGGGADSANIEKAAVAGSNAAKAKRKKGKGGK